MKRIIFTTLSLLLLGLYSNAQNCTPATGLPADFVGVYPVSEYYLPCDTIIPMDAAANVNCPYEFTFTAFVPTTIESGGLTLDAQNVVINSVDGLPNGLTWACEPSNCVFPAGQAGCMVISGIPNDVLGNYELAVSATVNATLPPFNIPLTLQINFPPDPADNTYDLPECPYTIVLEADNCTPVACEAPANTDVNMTTATNASFSWDAVTGADFYQVKYRLKGTTAWSTVGSGSSPRSANLTAKKYYQYKVRAQCGEEWSDFSPVTLFYTSACDAPTGVAVTFSDANRMRVRWDANPDEIKGKIRYRAVGITSWITQNSADGNNFLWVNNLPTNALIQYKLRSNCDGNDWSEYSSLMTQDLSLARLSTGTISDDAVKLYPNPTKDVLNMEFSTTDAEEVNITISNNLGEAVHILNNTYNEGIQRESIDMSSLANGYYFVTIRNGKKVETQKFMKMN
jgi:hypothetical protein